MHAAILLALETFRLLNCPKMASVISWIISGTVLVETIV